MTRLPVLAALLLAAAPAAAQEALNPLAGLSREALRDLTDRPLFSPSRSLPVIEEEEPVEAPPPSPPGAVLVGVMVAGGRSVAVVVDPDGGGSESVSVGDDIEGWEVAEIAADHLVVTLDDRRETLRMFVPGRTPAPGASDDDDDEATGGAARARPAGPRTGPPERDLDSLATATADELFERIRRRARRQ